MNICFSVWSLAILVSALYITKADKQCNIVCSTKDQAVTCGLDTEGNVYKMFPSPCALSAFIECYKVGYVETPIEFCIKDHNRMLLRRMYGESCPVFCPSHWKPVCGVSSRGYQTFNNGCFLDMLNCRGEYDDLVYREVPLSLCPKHAMKNIFRQQVMISGLRDYRDYEF